MNFTSLTRLTNSLVFLLLLLAGRSFSAGAVLTVQAELWSQVPICCPSNVLWLDANLSRCTLAGTNCTNATDLSGNNQYAYQITSGYYGPGIVSSVANGHAAFGFATTNTNCMYVAASNSTLMDASRSNIFLISAYKTTSGTAHNVILGVQIFGTDLLTYAPYSDGNFYWDTGNGGTQRISKNGTMSSFGVSIWWLTGTFQGIENNGATLTTGTISGAQPAAGIGPLGFGADLATGGIFANMTQGQVESIAAFTHAPNTNYWLLLRRKFGEMSGRSGL